MTGEQINIDIKGWTKETRETFMRLLRERYLPDAMQACSAQVMPPTVDERIAQAVAAERDRIRRLAESKGAHYHECGVPCSAEHSERPFADLLQGDEP